MTMRHASVALALLAVAVVSAQPAQGVLRIKVTLASDTQVSTPLQPHTLLVSDNPPSAEPRRIREGLYVFDADAIGPQCGTVTLSLYSETQPERADTLTPTRTIIDQIWNDFAPYRATSGTSKQQ